MNDTQIGFFDKLVSAANENPLAAALIGGGAFWLLVGNAKLKSLASATIAAGSSTADIGVRFAQSAASELERTVAPPTAPDIAPEGSFRAAETMRNAGNAASDVLSGAAGTVRDRFQEGAAYVRENLSNVSTALPGPEALKKGQSSLTDLLERQPLVLGAAGLAIGAAVATAFHSFDIENKWVGELSDDLKADLNTRAGAVSQSLREASDTLKAELSDAGDETVDRVRSAGIDAANAAREKAK
jgi:hypothetical protein